MTRRLESGLKCDASTYARCLISVLEQKHQLHIAPADARGATDAGDRRIGENYAFKARKLSTKSYLDLGPVVCLGDGHDSRCSVWTWTTDKT